MDILIDRSRVRKALGPIIALSPLLVLLLVLAPAAPAQAGSVVVGDGVHPASCNMITLGAVMNVNTDADITFACGGPATITITQPGGLNVVPGQHFSIDGGGIITITGNDAFPLFNVQSNAALTLTHLLLVHGAGGNGGCLFDNSDLTLTGVEIHHCAAGAGDSGGALYVAAGATARLNNANLHDNSADGSGGGIYNLGSLTVYTSTLAHNSAGTGDGGAVWTDAQAYLQGTIVYSNTATSGRGGGLYNTTSLQVNGGAITDNWAAQRGGGIYTDQGNTSLYGPILADNQAQDGAGLYAGGSNAQVTVSGSEISGNQASNDGGGIAHTGIRLTVSASVFRRNSAFVGGAIYNAGTLLTFITDSTLDANTASSSGGGLYNYNSAQLELDTSTLSGNSAVLGGGILNQPSAQASLNDSTLSGNLAQQFGGGLLDRGTATLVNTTLANNRALFIGGAINIDNVAFPGGVVRLTNTILAYSPQGGNCGGAAIASSKYSLSSDLTCQLTSTVHGLSGNGLDPHLSALGNYGGPTLVHMPEHHNPETAIDGVEGNVAFIIDQRGLPRLQGLGVDVGAVERQPNDSSLVPWLYLSLVQR